MACCAIEDAECRLEGGRSEECPPPWGVSIPLGSCKGRGALIKGSIPIPYADAFAAALAQKYNSPLVTGDPEFRRVEVIDLDWISS